MITCSRTHDSIGVLNAINACFDDIVEDGTDRSCIAFNTESECWLEFNSGDETIGYMQLKPYNRTTLDIHPYILPEKRRFSLECGKLAIDFFNQEAPEMYRKLISQVPSCYRHIKRYTLSLGFELEGTHKNSFLKNGQLLDLWLFGYERQAQ